MKNKDIFERNSIYDKRLSLDFDKLNKANNFDEIIIISDLGLSGKQLQDTINKYLSIEKGKNLKNGFHNIKDGEKFKQNLLNTNKITILNCVHTDIFVETVQNYFLNELNYKGELQFIGVEISYKDHLFSSKITNKRHKELFVEFVKTYFNEDELKVQGKSYFEYLNDIELEDTKIMLIARYKSMPKYHNVVFTKNTSLLKYRNDK